MLLQNNYLRLVLQMHEYIKHLCTLNVSTLIPNINYYCNQHSMHETDC